MSSFREGMLILCPRCTGLHTGFAAGSMLFFCINVWYRQNLLTVHTCSLLLLLSLPLIHWFLGFAGIIEPTAIARIYTGLIGGIAFGMIVIDRLFEYRGVESEINKAPGLSSSFKLLAIIIMFNSFAGYIFLILSESKTINSTLAFFVFFNLSLLLIVTLRIILDTFLKFKSKIKRVVLS